jgi:ATP-dependent RNA helicase RhlE
MKSTGRATSFVTAEDPQQLHAIERLLGHVVPWAAGSPHPSTDHPRSPKAQHPKGRSFSGRTAESRSRRHRTHSIQEGRQSPARTFVP